MICLRRQRKNRFGERNRRTKYTRTHSHVFGSGKTKTRRPRGPRTNRPTASHRLHRAPELTAGSKKSKAKQLGAATRLDQVGAISVEVQGKETNTPTKRSHQTSGKRTYRHGVKAAKKNDRPGSLKNKANGKTGVRGFRNAGVEKNLTEPIHAWRGVLGPSSQFGEATVRISAFSGLKNRARIWSRGSADQRTTAPERGGQPSKRKR